jgi:16S rRNA (guanine527-N7)-methyltransferase
MDKLVEGARQLGIEFSSQQLEQYRVYFEEIAKWNEKVNLTSITNYEEVQLKHFLDSLTVRLAYEKELWANAPFQLIDVGAGAGMPGLPLKIAFPDIKLLLIESVAKKSAFLSHLVALLKLSEADVINGRAEDIAGQENHREQYNLAVTRAVGKLSTVAELCLPFCTNGGLFIAMKKGDIGEEISSAKKAIDILGGSLREVKEVKVQGLDRRFLVVIEKISSTPSKYPRRAGIPSKRPL